MKSVFTLLLSCLCVWCFAQNTDLSPKPLDLVDAYHARSADFQAIAPFDLAAEKTGLVSEFDPAAVDYDVLNVDFSTLNRYFDADAPETFTLTVPSLSKNQTLELELVKVDIFTSDFQVTLASTQQAADVPLGHHYRGVIKGDRSSVVAVSVFDNEVMGLISSDEGNLVLGRLQGDSWNGEHILYDDRTVFQEHELGCATPDDGIGYKPKDLEFNLNEKAVGDCIRLYIEVDNDIHNQKGGVTAATNFTTGLLNEVITLYANENIASVVSEILVWDVTSPYSSTSSSGMLSDFQANLNGFNGDLGHLLSYQASGGVAAGFDGICNPNPDNSLCFSSIESTYAVVPTYSWSVFVTAHEFGHLWGSRHTHACVWNGNNTAIDGCAGSTEGFCSLPGSPSGGGTIMSYCHFTTGINFNEGFGPQPGNVIRNSVANANCTAPCGPASCTDGIQNGDETGVDCGGSCPDACPTCSDGIQNGNETGVDCGGPDCAPCPCPGPSVTLTINLDNYPEETSWEIRNGGGSVVASGGTYGSQPDGSQVVENICLPADGCYDFTIFDSYGDGICCSWGTGDYTLTDDSNGATLASGGSFGSSETTNFCVSSGGGDTQAPTAPTNLIASNTTTTTTDLSWNASSDNVGVDGYYVYVNGSNIGSVTGTSAQITGLTPSTTYAMYVTAFDAAGNESSASNTVNVTTLSEGGGGCSAGVLSSNSFESGWEDWNDGGGDCTRRNEPSNSWDGSYSIRIRDNSGSASAMTSDPFDLSEFSSVDVEFYFRPVSMENGEDFWVRYNDGSGWQTVATYVVGSGGIVNNTFYVATVTLNAGSFNLSSNARFRFQCDASVNNDRVYIDLVTISGNCSALPNSDGPVTTVQELETPARFLSLETTENVLDIEDVQLYPNPARDELNLEYHESLNIRAVRIFSLSGAAVKGINSTNNYESIDISSLQPGIYFLSIETEGEVINKRFVKQ